MQSCLVSIPSAPTSNVLVFLHGVGEAFIPVEGAEEKMLYSADPGDVLKRPGVQNLLHHGVPRILSTPGEVLSHDPKASADSPPFSYAPFEAFVTIAPQAFRREDLADDGKNEKMMDRVYAIAKSVTPAEPRIAIMGFSRGGFAALTLGSRPEVAAIVTMDAVAKGAAVERGPVIANQPNRRAADALVAQTRR